MKRTVSSSQVTLIFIILLCGLIVISAAIVPLLSQRIYEKLSVSSAQNERDCLSYITQAIRRADSKGSIKIRDFRGTSALALQDLSEGAEDVTLIYLWDGMLCELTINRYNLTASPEQGTAIMPATYLLFTRVSNKLIQVECNAGNGLVMMNLCVRTGEGGEV